LHDHVLALPDELVLRFHDGLQKLEILHVLAMCFDAVHRVLDHLFIHFIAQGRIVLEDAANCLSFQNLKCISMKVSS
jgi:hypothetical protein